MGRLELGVISPSGELRKCYAWEHYALCEKIIKENGLWEDFLASLDKKLCYSPKHYLLDRNYVILSDPEETRKVEAHSRGLLTKAQIETLYDYFIEIGDRKQANALYTENMSINIIK